MSSRKPNNVERLLVFPGHDCPCCAGRFGFEHGLRALSESHPIRTQKEILKLNPLFIRQLPSFRHQEVHVETMMSAIGPELPRLFKKWRKHLQTYPEMPFLLHFVLAKGNSQSLHLSPETLTACKKASPFKLGRAEWGKPTGFSLKQRWARPEVVSEVIRGFAEMLSMPGGMGLNDYLYLPQLKVLYSDQLKALEQLSGVRTNPPPIAEDATPEEETQRRCASRYEPTMIDNAYRNLAETILPAMIRAAAAEARYGGDRQIQSMLSEFFDAGGSYEKSSFDIARLVLRIESELLLLLDRYRSKLNNDSIRVLDRNLVRIQQNLETRRAEEAVRQERERAERVQRQAEEAEREREHQRVEAERAEHRATVQVARSESLASMTERLSTLPPDARMKAIADQIAYAPACFPDEWAQEFTGADFSELDDATLEALTEKTRGVQRGEWKHLHRRLLEEVR